MSEPVKVEFAYPSAKEQTKQAFIATGIGLAPIAVMIGGLAVWSKVSDWRASRKPAVEQTEDTVAE